MEREKEITIGMPYWLVGGEIRKEKNQRGNILLQKVDEFSLAQWALECWGNEQVKIGVLWPGSSI